MVDLDPKVPTTQALGPAQTEEQYLADKRARLTQAIEARPDDFNAYMARGNFYAGRTRWHEAIADYTEAIRTRPPKNIRPYRKRAEAYMQLKEYAKAAADYERYAELLPAGPFPAIAYNNLAWLYVTGPPEIRDAGKAIPLAERAVELDPDNAGWLNTLGVVYYRNGQFEEAVQTLTRATAASEEGGTAFDFFFLAMSHHRLGRAKDAADAYEKAVRDSHKPVSAELTAFRAEADTLFAKDRPNRP